jgi:hypothetical protein
MIGIDDAPSAAAPRASESRRVIAICQFPLLPVIAFRNPRDRDVEGVR